MSRREVALPDLTHEQKRRDLYFFLSDKEAAHRLAKLDAQVLGCVVVVVVVGVAVYIYIGSVGAVVGVVVYMGEEVVAAAVVVYIVIYQ
jgi:hypothetical protein